MKKKITLSFSLSLLLIVLFFWGQQEMEKSRNMLTKLAHIEQQASYKAFIDFDKIVTADASPLIVFLENGKIRDLLVSKCELGRTTITFKNGKETSWNKGGDAGIILSCISEGHKYIDPNPEEEISYYKRSIKTGWFSIWEYLKYFSHKFFILFLIMLPILLSFQLLLFVIALIILLISLIKISGGIKEKKQAKSQIEYSIKKPPPKNSVQIIDDSSQSLAKEPIITQLSDKNPLVQICIKFFTEFNDKTRKAVNKIFHIPEFKFVAY